MVISLRCERKVTKKVGDGQCLTLAAVHDFISTTGSFLLYLRKYGQMGFFNFIDFSFNCIGTKKHKYHAIVSVEEFGCADYCD